MNFLQIIKLVLQLIPIVIEAMKVLETQIPAQGQGATKMKLLQEMLSDVSSVATDVSQENYATAFNKAIAVATSIMKATGFFSGK